MEQSAQLVMLHVLSAIYKVSEQVVIIYDIMASRIVLRVAMCEYSIMTIPILSLLAFVLVLYWLDPAPFHFRSSTK